MRRTPLLLVAGLVVLGALGVCGDDDDAEGGGGTPSEELSTEGVCEVLDGDRVSAVMGVAFDRAVASEGSCTYTSTTAQTAFTLQLSAGGADDPALVLETMGASCDADTREDRTFRGADGGFACLAGGVPNVVAIGQGQVLVLTGNSREAGVAPEAVVDQLATILEDALATLAES